MQVTTFPNKMNVYQFILKKIDKYFQKISWDSHTKFLGDVGYRYIPAPIDFIYDSLKLINEKEPIKGKRFLDVGCGIGNVCGIAVQFGCVAEGIELNPVLNNVSKELFPEIIVHNMNISEFNTYSDYDIIFYFLPYQIDELEEEMIKKIENSVKIGTYIIVEIEENKDDRFISIPLNNVNNKIWQKIK